MIDQSSRVEANEKSRCIVHELIAGVRFDMSGAMIRHDRVTAAKKYQPELILMDMQFPALIVVKRLDALSELGPDAYFRPGRDVLWIECGWR